MTIRYTITYFGPNKESEGYDLEFIDQQTQQKYAIWEPDIHEFEHDFNDFNTVGELDNNLEILHAIRYARELKDHPEYYQDDFLKLTNEVYEIEN